MRTFSLSWQRIWQPQRGLFWLTLAVNALSSLLVAFIQFGQPPESLRWVLSLLALSDTLLGWWLLRRLWRKGDLPAASGP